MATKVVMEALSPTMEEGRLVKWHKAEGETVQAGDVLAEVETDKAIMELVARGDGVLRKQLLAEGATAPVGQLLAVLAAPNENINALLAAGPAATPPAPQSATASASGAASASASGSATLAAAPPRPAAPPPPPRSAAGSALSSVPAPVPAPVPAVAPKAATVAAAPPTSNGGRVRASPLARRLATARGVDLRAVSGSGPQGRVIKRDIEALPAVAPTGPPRPRVIPEDGDYHDVALTQIRKTIARRLAESIGPVPTFYLTVMWTSSASPTCAPQWPPKVTSTKCR